MNEPIFVVVNDAFGPLHAVLPDYQMKGHEKFFPDALAHRILAATKGA